MAPTLKLYYFDIKGRGESIRVALSIAGIPFEDVRLSHEAFAKMKETNQLPFGQVPIMDVDGKRLAQSSAILRYVGRLGGLYPQDPWQAAKVDEIMYAFEDVGNLLRPSFMEQDPQKRLEMRKQLVAEAFPKWFSNIQRVLQANGTNFFVGNELTIADIAAFNAMKWLTGGFLDGVPTTVLDDYPALVKHMHHFEQLPKIQEYYAKNK